MSSSVVLSDGSGLEQRNYFMRYYKFCMQKQILKRLWGKTFYIFHSGFLGNLFKLEAVILCPPLERQKKYRYLLLFLLVTLGNRK